MKPGTPAEWKWFSLPWPAAKRKQDKQNQCGRLSLLER
jgi:hypothetical protein